MRPRQTDGIGKETIPAGDEPTLVRRIQRPPLHAGHDEDDHANESRRTPRIASAMPS